MASGTQERPPGKRATKTPVIFDAVSCKTLFLAEVARQANRLQDEQEAQREAELAAVYAEAMARVRRSSLLPPQRTNISYPAQGGDSESAVDPSGNRSCGYND